MPLAKSQNRWMMGEVLELAGIKSKDSDILQNSVNDLGLASMPSKLDSPKDQSNSPLLIFLCSLWLNMENSLSTRSRHGLWPKMGYSLIVAACAIPPDANGDKILPPNNHRRMWKAPPFCIRRSFFNCGTGTVSEGLLDRCLIPGTPAFTSCGPFSCLPAPTPSPHPRCNAR